MTDPLDFQSIIMTLQHFWADHGCLIWQPYNSQVGAGTMNPATFLRVLGPEPWNVGYLEPSVRPDDGRYGENPNRFQQHTQFQVILKPDPGNPQELYLQSLEALGIDPRQHDIRFVEDNWESPALGAWGLGWEVWLDGQEITQFTYFQQAGGQTLNPVSVEITYGLERIAMTLQRVRHFRQLRWNDAVLYGDVYYQGEYEHSKYYFEIADVDRLRQMYDLFESESTSALKAGLVLPAYDYILKCSHTFNVLDSRGAVGVTERQALFARMRDLSRQVAEAYLEQRQRLEYPWLKLDATSTKQVAGRQQILSSAVGEAEIILQPSHFLLEIGTEELPPADLESALTQLREQVPVLLDELRLSHGAVKILGTPRRLVVSIMELAARQPDQEIVHRGPPSNRAYDSLGVPTKAAEGFARSKGVGVEELQVTEIDGGSYVVARVFEPGRLSTTVLSQELPGLIASLRFDKSMRWNESNVSFSRPIRWLLALFGEHVIPFSYAGLNSDRLTRGLRFHGPHEIEVASPEVYFALLHSQGIFLDSAHRREVIAEQVRHLMMEAKAEIRIEDSLLDEVNDLVEAPTALVGGFSSDHLKLPEEVLVSVMKKHQRYFPLWGKDGHLLPHFIAVRNGDNAHLGIVTDGNEQVIQARFADAAFFITEDKKHRLEDFLPRLATLTFQTLLGSMLDKSLRIEKLVESLAPLFSLDESQVAVAQRAAKLCKADLVSHMVVEMTSVQGIMGRYYALNSGERSEVAQAIYDHYLPRFTGDDFPTSRPGLVIGLADRLDTLMGLFAAGLAPSGTKDPFAQRRAALGLVQNLVHLDLDFDLRQGLLLAAQNLPIKAAEGNQSACLDFIMGRLRSSLNEQGYRYDVVDAVLAAQGNNPAGCQRAVKALAEWVSHPNWSQILPAYARCVRITRDKTEKFPILPDAFVEPVEKEFFKALQTAEQASRRPGSVEDFLSIFLPLIPVINRFFEAVLVMAGDPVVRSNRLGMLQHVASLADGVADLSILEGF